jgi:hypothetical protein
MALGRISGPLLKSNLLRNGVNLAFETDLLYLDVVNRRVGINTSSPSDDLEVVGTIRSTNVVSSGTSTLGTISFSTNNITSTSNQINLVASGANPVVYQATLQVGNLQLTGSTISTMASNQDIVFTTTGTGAVTVNSNLTVNGNFTTQGDMSVAGNITVRGNIQIGDATTDTVSIVAGVNSNIIPATTNTYNLGSSSLRWANVYASNLTLGTFTATNFSTANLNFANGTITNTVNNQDISLVTSGTGGINIGNFKINGNSITNTVSNAVTNFSQKLTTAVFTGSISTGNTISFTGSIAGNVLTVSTAPNNGLGGSIVFNGSSSLTMSAPFKFEAYAYTIETFLYFTSTPNNTNIIGATTNGGGGLNFSVVNTTSLFLDHQGYTGNTYSFATPITLNAWHHVVVTRNAGGQEMAFIDGVRSTSSYGANFNFQDFTGTIGTGQGGNNFAGRLSNLKITLGSNTYDPTAANITVPISPITISANTRLLMLALTSGGVLDDATTLQVLTSNNTTYSSNGPFSSILAPIVIGQVLSGGSLPTGTYITGNISGTGTASSSQWTINNYLTQLSTTITSTPTLLNVTAMTSGTILQNMVLTGTNVLNGTVITAFVSGTGTTGTYYVSPSQTIASTTVTGNIQGYVNIGGTNGVVLPAGTTSQRPAQPIAGMVRFNADPLTLAVEIYNGSSWTGVAGIQSGITVAQATDISAQWALTLG